MFKVEFQTSNVAFGGDDLGAEVASILRKLAERIEAAGWSEGHTDEGTVMDLNGNSVGEWCLTPDE